MPTVRALPPSYFRLVEQFPLVSIQDDAELDAAQTVLDQLLMQEGDAGFDAYVLALTDLIETYESTHYPMDDSPAQDVIRDLMEAHNLSGAELSRRTGIAKATVSDLLNGKRLPTVAHAAKLGKVFSLPPSAFLPVE